eukprot:gene25698-biopygen10534
MRVCRGVVLRRVHQLTRASPSLASPGAYPHLRFEQLRCKRVGRTGKRVVNSKKGDTPGDARRGVLKSKMGGGLLSYTWLPPRGAGARHVPFSHACCRVGCCACGASCRAPRARVRAAAPRPPRCAGHCAGLGETAEMAGSSKPPPSILA